MTISRDDVRHIAQLARLRLSEDELRRMTDQLSGILEHIAVLQEADVSGVTPETTLLPAASVMRADQPAPSYPIEALLANAPDREDRFVRVKAVLD